MRKFLILLVLPLFFLGSSFGGESFPAKTAVQSTGVYSAGTAYTLTATPALLDFGTTDPSITLPTPGTWLIYGRAKIDYTGATFAAVRTVPIKLRRINNTAADLTNGSVTQSTNIVTTLTCTMGEFVIPPIIYITTNSDDNIQLFGSVSVLPTAGTIDVNEASIVAIRIA